ncbi:MAG: ISAs1 family transposase [Crocinitomicaceae bacterium]|nr:ISAs1 family transposase [Crocinitomicaceae bacterium]
MKMNQKLETLFSEIDDPRRDIGIRHKLNDILHIGIIAVVCGAETWNNIEEYACAKEGFLRKFLELPNGIPTHDTFNRVFSSLDPKQFESGFIKWVNALATISHGEVVAIDGKTIRGGKSHGKKSPFHIVSAWANQSNLVLGQVMTDEKSNEITAIPKLLEILALEGSIVTIDAMGCQKDIAEKIIAKNADYILAVKANQEELHEDIIDEFRFCKAPETHTTVDGDHGRIETRTCSIISSFSHIQNPQKWKQLQTIIKIESTREFKNSSKPNETAQRYYISSLKAKADIFQMAVRSHWGVENKLHWTLDVAFGEDASRKRKGNAAQNFSTLNKIALNLLKNEKTLKIGVKGRRLKAGWDDIYLRKVLNL